MNPADHILIVDDDDDADIRSLLGTYFTRNGVQAAAVGDGKAMWRALNASHLDLVVLDVMCSPATTA